MSQTTLQKQDWYNDFKNAVGSPGFRGRPQPKSQEAELADLKTWVVKVATELGELKRSLPNLTNNGNGKFDPTKHLIKVQGGRQYLEVKWRLVWFRQDHPDWAIETEPVEINTEKMYSIFRATVKDQTGRVIATATKAESKNGFSDYLEKSETGAVGRCLALCGFGTQFSPELSEGDRIVDAPINNDGDKTKE